MGAASPLAQQDDLCTQVTGGSEGTWTSTADRGRWSVVSVVGVSALL